ncbi:MAG TPA: DUF2065 domain-containing protein [Candidatus Angelobacter sp.]|nr:DUF2065 domain-containing protein [Candidatus Angelobacter sp.]
MIPPSGWSDLVTALGLVLVIEGLLLALMPDMLKRLIAEILTQPARRLRFGGLVSALVGVVVVWLVRG